MADTKENEKLQTVANISTLNVVSRCKEEVKDIHGKLVKMQTTFKSIDGNNFKEFDYDDWKKIISLFDIASIQTNMIVQRMELFLEYAKASPKVEGAV